MLEVERLERREVMSAAQMWSIGNGVYDLAQTLQLHSNPTATRVVYLDFNGHTTGDVYGSSWDNLTSPAWDPSGNGATFSTAEMQTIQRVWARVAEDFAPFNIDVTTQDPGVEALRKSGSTDQYYGVRVVITPSDAPAPGAGGVAYIGSFNFSTDTPAYVFNTSEKSIAEAATHEVGHALGLGHDGTSSLGYYGGHGSGVTSWGPIMGASYNPNVTQWSKGEYSGANNTQDDLAIIVSQNGFGYVADDVGPNSSAATSLLTPGASQIPTFYGVISQNTDGDAFSFYANAGQVTINIDTAPLGPNLAVAAYLYNSSGTLLASFNPANSLNAVVSYSLPTAGQYFLGIVGVGKGSPLTTGFSNYGSLGNYRITGTVPAYTGGGGGPTNSPPVAVNDVATAVVGTPLTINVLGNDSDPNGDTLTLVSLSNVVGGTASISGNQVIFTATAAGTGSFTYVVSDGKGGTATGTVTITATAPPPPQTATFTNNTDVTIASNRSSTVTSTINVSGLTGTLQDVDVKVNVYHTWDSDLVITLIAPDGTRIVLFNRHGGSNNNILGTTFDDSATTSIAYGSAPFTGSFKPWQALSALNGKSPNGAWRLEIRDNYSLDGGRLDNWSIVLKTSATAAPAANPTTAFSTADFADFLVRQSSSTLADTFFANDFGPWRNNLFANPNLLRNFVRSMSDGQLRSIFEEWFGAQLESDLPRR